VTRFHAGVGAALAHLLAGGVLVIDDAQWLDESSAAMVAFLLTHRSERSPQIVLALREDALTPDRGLSPLIRRLMRSGAALRLDVGALPDAAARALVADYLGEGMDRDLAGRILALAGGNPLFLLAYLDAAGSEDQELPPGIDELVGARVEALDEAAGQLLAAASVIGPEFDSETLRAVAGRSEEETVAGVEQMVRRRLVRETSSGLAFVHEVVRNAVYRRMTSARRRLLHGRAAAALRKRGAPASYADHFERAGRSDEAALAHAAAANDALALFAYPEAREHLVSALSLGHPDRPSLNLRLGDAALRMGDYGQALAAYEAVGRPGSSAEVEHRIGEVYRRLGRLQLAEAAYQTAASLATDPALAALIAVNRALVAHQQSDDERARRLATDALALASRAGEGAIVAQAWNLTAVLTEDPQEAVARLEKALALAEETGRSDVAAAAWNNLALARRRLGDNAAAVTAARQALVVLEPVGDRHQLAALHSNLADALHAVGDDDLAREHLTKSARLFAEVGVEADQWEPEIWKLSEW
jgi:tetratricopeptide (TPR) repeat protein